MMDHEAIRQEIAAYALDALDDEERARVEHDLVEHLPGCAECSAMLRDFREVASDLAVAPTPRAVSSSGEESLLRKIRADALGERRRPGRRVWLRAAAVAAAAALAVTSASLVRVSGHLDRSERRVRALARAFAMAADPRNRVVPIVGPAGSMVLAFGPGGTVLVGERIPDPPDGRVYELWLLREGSSPRPLRTFVPDAGFVSLVLPRETALYEQVGITQEREFVSAPTGSPIYLATLSA